MTLRRFLKDAPDVPMATAWYLADIAESRGKQELFTRQSPQRLKTLREHAMVESAVSSNRIEGVEVSAERARAIVLGRPKPRDRSEEEIAGYRDALRLIHASAQSVSISERTIRELHRTSRGDEGDAGEYKRRDVDIIEKYADGRSRVRFKTVSARRTPAAMRDLAASWAEIIEAHRVHPLVAVAAFNLDFLCIHPFRDGNGRVSRLLLLLQCYHFGYDVGKYVSLERIIEQHKDRYYETLELSSVHWHESRHDPWPCINFLLFVIRAAYAEFEQRAGQVKAPRGEKSERVKAEILRKHGAFAIADVQRACPDVSVDLIRHVLKTLRTEGAIQCLGRGRTATWRRADGSNG